MAAQGPTDPALIVAPRRFRSSSFQLSAISLQTSEARPPFDRLRAGFREADFGKFCAVFAPEKGHSVKLTVRNSFVFFIRRQAAQLSTLFS